MGTLGKGLYSFSRNFRQSSRYLNAYEGDLVYAKEVQGQLFFCTKNDNSVYKLERSGKRLIRFANDTPITSAFFIDEDLRCYHFTDRRSAYVDNILDNNKRVKHLRTSFHWPTSFKKFIKSGNSFYVNAGQNVCRVDIDTIMRSGLARYIPLLQRDERVFSLAKSTDGMVWFSTVDKMYKIENGKCLGQGQFGKLVLKNFDFYGKYIVGYSHDNKLYVCEQLGENLRKTQIKDECVWTNIHKLDSNHALIETSSLYYLLSFNPSGSGKPFSISPIENAYLPLQPEAVCIGNNDCYFFKEGAITQVRKSDIFQKPDQPVVHFTSLKTSKNVYRIKDRMAVGYDEADDISISFSTLSFGSKDVIYQYSIPKKGGDNWVTIKGDINLARPTFGSYVVKVRARTISSTFGAPIVFTLVILRPFWATWWFICLCAGGAAALIALQIRRQIKLAIKKKEKEHESHVKFIKSEYKAMNALMNPHFIFNSLNNVQSLVIDNDTLNATEYLGIFADLIRQNMHNVSNETISLQQEINLVENYLLLEKLRFEDQLNYTIEVDEGLFLNEIMVPPLLVQPLVENSIKYGVLPLRSLGKQGFIRISIYKQSDRLYITVEDNGPGINSLSEKKKGHSSYGLDNLRRRVQQLSIIQDKEITFHLANIQSEAGTCEGAVATITVALS